MRFLVLLALVVVMYLAWKWETPIAGGIFGGGLIALLFEPRPRRKKV